MPKRGTSQKTNLSERPIACGISNDPPLAPNPEGALSAPTLFHEQIAARAYALFLARGGQHGEDQGDWFRAEAELRREGDLGGTLSPK